MIEKHAADHQATDIRDHLNQGRDAGFQEDVRELFEDGSKSAVGLAQRSDKEGLAGHAMRLRFACGKS